MSVPREVLHDGFRYELLECEHTRYANGWAQYRDGNKEEVLHIRKDSGIVEIFQPSKVRISRIGRDSN